MKEDTALEILCSLPCSPHDALVFDLMRDLHISLFLLNTAVEEIKNKHKICVLWNDDRSSLRVARYDWVRAVPICEAYWAKRHENLDLE